MKLTSCDYVNPEERPYVYNVYTTVINVNLFHMPGANVANLNAGGIQSIGSIDQRIGELKAKEEAKSFAEAIQALTEAITSAQIAEEPRQEALEQVDALTQQATLPENQRKRGAIRPYVESLAGLCAGAGGLAAIWQTVGPVIRAYFGF